jgi:hypothetical protein
MTSTEQADVGRSPEGVATWLALAMDAHAAGRKSQALALLGRAAEALTAGKGVRRFDFFVGAALAGILSNTLPQNDADAGQVVDTALALADRLLAEMDG